MLARRRFLTMLGLAAAAPVAVKVVMALPAAPPTVPLFAEGDLIYQGCIVRNVDSIQIAYGTMRIKPGMAWGLVEGSEDRDRDEEFFRGEQWTPQQIASMEARRG